MLLAKEVKMRSVMLASLLAVVISMPAAGVTVEFRLETNPGGLLVASVPADGLDHTVALHIICTVSDGDNNGLALFACDILTDTGITQPVDLAPGAWSISSQNGLSGDFFDVQSEFFDGVAVGDDLIQVGAGQHTFVAWFFSLGYGQAGGIGAGQELALGAVNIPGGLTPATFHAQLGYCKATVIKSTYDHNTPVWPAVDDVADVDLVLSAPVEITRGVPPVLIETVASMGVHGGVGELPLYVDIAATASNLIRTESREDYVNKLVIDCDANPTLPVPPENLVTSIVGDLGGDVTGYVASVSAVADIITITLNPVLPDQDTYTVTLDSSVIGGDNDFRIRALRSEVVPDVSSQVVNALDLSKVRQMFTADVTVSDNAKYDIVSDGAINALDLSKCRQDFTHTAP